MTAAGAVPIAVAQFRPGDDREKNLEQIESLVAQAVSRGARLVVAPEYSSFFDGGVTERSVAAAEGLDGRFVLGLGGIARQHGCHVVAGMLERVPGEARVHNLLVAVGPDGDVVATYRKQHLYDAFGYTESERVAPGPLDEPEIFEVSGIRVGLQTCYDLRFPEVSRRLADAGADLVLVPAQWVRGPLKERHWQVLVQARALENTFYVAAADQSAPQGVGLSTIVDPMGVPCVELGEQDGLGVAWVDPERIADSRRTNPALRLRRYRVVPGVPSAT